ncbi:MAG: choline dehydrogenase [Paracoccaceae bacterium]|nr:choline dehydrogenase [Paracoccaceae bacterium]
MQFDYVVVGAGSAGCAIAARLSEDATPTVALIEAGGRGRNPWLHIPVGYFKTMHNPSVDWCYRTAPEPGLNGRRIEWPRGKVLGGSSALNGLLYVRGQPQDYDHWRQLGNPGWAWDDVLSYFKRSERQERGGNKLHGGDGPLAVSDMRAHRALCDKFIAAAVAAGIPANDDFNGTDQEGVGYYQLTMTNGLRCSSATAFLKPARRRPNLHIVTDAMTRRVILERGRAIGVEIERAGIVETVHAGREVVLAAGAIGSPQILQLSGLGPAELLRSHGIDVACDLPGVGENLQDHLQARAVYEVTEPTLNDEVNSLFGQMRIGIEFILKRTGPMTMGASQVGAFARTRPDCETPDIQFHIQPLSSQNPGHGLDRFSAFTTSVCQLRPESRGHVRITSADPNVHPAICANYLKAEVDRTTTIAGVRVGRRIAEASPLAEIVKDEREPGYAAETDDEILDWIRDRATTIYHPAGTCKMGQDDMAVVDARLRVHGVDGLRVADASIMPTITSGNTNAPAIMIGEKVADMVAQDARARSAA